MSTFVMSSVRCRAPFPGHCHAELAEVAKLNDQCRFGVAWTINPHMIKGSTKISVAAEQHLALREAIVQSGGRILDVPFVCGGLDSVFVKDNAFLFEAGGSRYALMGRPRFQERKIEQAPRTHAYRKLGFEILSLNSCREPVNFEGGDLVMAPEGAFLGFGFRSDRLAAEILSERLGLPIMPLQLTDPYLYHLDTALCILKDGTAIACREAFSSDSWKALERCSRIGRLIAIERNDALQFGCNLVQSGYTVILGSSLPKVENILTRLGYEPVAIPLKEFQQAGGSAACLVAEIHDSKRFTTSPMAAILSTEAYA